ncbi:MAG TPA: hypothetical protein VII83_05235 [Gaiellaceae bacterium]|jgi:hypothetical protein
MARLLLLLALCATFAAAILAGPAGAAWHRPAVTTVPVVTVTSDSSTPVVTGHGGGRMHY